MKNIIYAIAVVLSVSCTGKNSDCDSLLISGNIFNIDAGIVKVLDDDGSVIDSCLIEDGKFRVDIKLDYPRFITIIGNDIDDNNVLFSRLLAENSDIEISSNPDTRKTEFKGAALHDEYMEYMKYLLSLPEQEKVQDLYDDITKASVNGDEIKKNELYEELYSATDSVVSKLLNFKTDSPNSQAAAALVYEQISRLSNENKKFALSKFSKTLNSYYLDLLKNDVK